MANINMQLSDYYKSNEEDGKVAIHDWKYNTLGHRGSNSDTTVLQVDNVSGNGISVAVFGTRYNGHGNLEEYLIDTHIDITKVELLITGAWEHSNMLDALRYILNAEKMMAKLDPPEEP